MSLEGRLPQELAGKEEDENKTLCLAVSKDPRDDANVGIKNTAYHLDTKFHWLEPLKVGTLQTFLDISTYEKVSAFLLTIAFF